MHAIPQDLYVVRWIEISCHFTRSGKVYGVVKVTTDFSPALTTIYSVVMCETESTYGHHVSDITQEMINHPFL